MLDVTNKEDYLNGSVHKNLIIVLEDGSTISNKNILKESMSLDEILMEDNQLHFGRCNINQFSITLAAVASNIKNEKIKVYIESNNVKLQLGEFSVNFVEKSADKSFKQITALDNMQNIDQDVTEWYRALHFPMIQKDFRDSFFSYVGIEQVDVDLPFDELIIDDPFGNMVFINGRIIAEGICELNARFGHCNREGKFEYIQLNSDKNGILDINKKYINCSYDDFVTQTIDRVIIVDEYGTQVATSDSGNNAYVINNNFMLYGRTVDELRTLGNQFLELVKDVEYTPFTMENRGLPYVQLGDSIHATTNNGEFNSFIFRRTLRGIQALRDTYSAEGEEYLISDLNSIQQKIDEANRNTERTRVELTTSMEGLKSTITSIETIAESASEVAERANQTATNANSVANNANTVANQANTKADDIAEDLDKNYSTTVEIQSQIKQSADSITSTVSKTYATQESVKATTDNLQQQIDGAVETFTGSAVPTLTNSPAKDWTTTAIKDTHIGDLYIVNSSGGNYAGFYYRFEKSGSTYQWVLLKDNEVTKALQDAKEANDKAQAVANNLSTNYSTTAQMNSAIEQSANSIKSTVSATYTTKDEFNNLEIGGRNLVVGSATHNFKQYSISPYVGAVTVVDDTDAISKKHIEVKCTTAGIGFYSYPYKCKAGTTYTYSFWAKCSVTKSGDRLGFENGGTMAINLTTEWQYYKHTFTATDKTSNAFINYLVYNANEIFYIRDFKLEEGTKATTWTPAPEDVDSSISSVDTKATNAQSTANTANSKATTNANNITGLTTRVTNAESSITQNANQIELKVSKGDVSSQLSVESEQVTISGNRLVVDADNFSLSADGSMECSKANITGGSFNVTTDNHEEVKVGISYSDKYKTQLTPSSVHIEVPRYNGTVDFVTDLSAGVYTPIGEYALMTNDGTRMMVLGQDTLAYGTKGSTETISHYSRNGCKVAGELQSTSANGLRIVYGNYGFFIRNDGSHTYFLLTASGDQYGTYNSLRPLYINNSTGLVTLGNGLSTTSISASGTISANYLKAGPTNGTAIRLIRCGSSVLTPGSTKSTGVKLLAHSTVKGWYSGASASNTAILVTNGDGAANGVHIEGVTYTNSDASWYVVCDTAPGKAFRVNYVVICW